MKHDRNRICITKKMSPLFNKFLSKYKERKDITYVGLGQPAVPEIVELDPPTHNHAEQDNHSQ